MTTRRLAGRERRHDRSDSRVADHRFGSATQIEDLLVWRELDPAHTHGLPTGCMSVLDYDLVVLS